MRVKGSRQARGKRRSGPSVAVEAVSLSTEVMLWHGSRHGDTGPRMRYPANFRDEREKKSLKGEGKGKRVLLEGGFL